MKGYFPMDEHTPLDPAQQSTGDMDPAAFRHYGYQVVDWIANYLEDVKKYPVLSQNTPGDVRRALPAHPPAQPEAMEAILADVDARDYALELAGVSRLF
jgi:aromatic-L-amino-acid/L-tryptophan decarboxylase